MLKSYFTRALVLFCMLGFVFIPLTFFGLEFQYSLTRCMFVKPITFIQNHCFPYALKNIDFSSDTIGLNILLCLLLVLAFLIVGLLDAFKVRSAKLLPVFRSVSAYYIAAILLKYGFDKIFKQQFALPEPNILYSNYGSLTKDTLFWSTIGLSHTYNMVTGLVEVLTALLILIKPTRVLGYCFAIGVLANIVLINFSFDISVKTFSVFLLAVVLFNVYPFFKSICAFFVQRKQVQLAAPQSTGRLNIVLSIALVAYILFPYILSGKFNGDNAPRPFLHGAYSINRFVVGNDTLQKDQFPYKRFFIHRDSYIIFQRQDDGMADYHFNLDPVNKQLHLEDYNHNKLTVNFSYDEKTGTLQLRFNNKQKWSIWSQVLNWKALPALQGNTHYSIDEVR